MEPENIIKSILEEDDDWDKSCGSIKLKFMRLIPSFKIIDKDVPMSFFFDTLSKIKNEEDNNGICVSINSSNLKVKNYFKFVSTLFRNQKIKVIDQQRMGGGAPDFKIEFEDSDDFFFIEFKSMNDSVRPNQLQWLGDNPEKETWFLMLGEIESLIESESLQYIRQQEAIDKIRRTEEISCDISKRVTDNLQNIVTKKQEKEQEYEKF